MAVCSWIFLGLLFFALHISWHGKGKPTCVHNCRNFYNVVSWFFSSCHFCSAIVTLQWSGADRQQRSGITAWCNLPTSPKSNPWCWAPSGEAAGTISIISALTRPGSEAKRRPGSNKKRQILRPPGCDNQRESNFKFVRALGWVE